MDRNFLVLAAAAGLVMGAAAVQAQAPRDRDSGATPGHMMQEHGNVPGHPGASGYAPGHDRGDMKGDRDDRTTGAGDRDDRRGDRDEMRHGDRDDFRKGDRDDR